MSTRRTPPQELLHDFLRQAKRLFYVLRPSRTANALRTPESRLINKPSTSSLNFSFRLGKSRRNGASRLPNEVWLLILRIATVLQRNPLDPSSEVSFMDTESLVPLQSAYKENMHAKLVLSLVNRRFSILMRQFLYEFVLLTSAVQARALAHTLITEVGYGNVYSSGRYIRGLHVETRTLERCAPMDMCTILQHSPLIAVYIDRNSVRCSRIGKPDPSPATLFAALARSRSRLRRLTVTEYDLVPIHIRMRSIIASSCAPLEYLEIFSSSPDYPVFNAPPDWRAVLSFPALRSLKVAVDDVTFSILSSWKMPVLSNLSVVSCELNYSGVGFTQFFQAYGAQLNQLELGHSSTLVERTLQREPFPLSYWCPNLREFICSADAEWHWESPDWIPPHVLLPAHAHIELIGIRDIDVRLREDPNTFSLLAQLSCLRRDAFPNLRFIRDISAESHAMRTRQPAPRIISFWMELLKRLKDDNVWLEDYEGLNITPKGLRRASLTGPATFR